MRQADPPVSYLVGTPKGRLSKLEKALLGLPWQVVRQGVDVKLLPHEQELYVLAQSHARIHKERAMRRRKLKWLWARLKQIAAMELTREELLMKLGAARAKARAAWRLIDVEVAPDDATFSFALNRDKLRQTRRREGRYLLPICATGIRPTCGSSISYSSRSRPRSRISRTICNSARSTTSLSTASKRTSSLPSWPIAFTSRCALSSSRWRPASHQGLCSTSSPPSRCSTSTSRPLTAAH